MSESNSDLFARTMKSVGLIARQTFNFASEISSLVDNTNVFQPDLENESSCYQFLPDLFPFNLLLLFKPYELGRITQLLTFDTRCAEMYVPKQMQSLRANIIHSSPSDTVLNKLTRTTLTEGKVVRGSDP